MINTKMVYPASCFILAMLLVVDFLRASIGASSFVAFTHFELTIAIEFYLAITLLVMAYRRLRNTKVKSTSIGLFFSAWFVIFAIITGLAMNTEKKLSQHWDDQILLLINYGHAPDINKVDWNKNAADFREQCIITEKVRVKLFDLYRYHVTCANPHTLLVTTLSIDTLTGKASAYVEFPP